MIGAAVFAVVGVLFLFAAIHVFTATLYQSLFGRLPNTTIGVIALVVFAAALLALVTARRLAPRRAIALTAATLAIATLTVAGVRQEWVALVASAIGVVAGTQWLALLHAARTPTRGSPLPLALPVAIVVDHVLWSAFTSVPVIEQPLVLAVPLAVVAAFVFLASGIASLAGDLAWGAPGWRGTLGLIAIPPLLLVAWTGGANAAQIAANGLGADNGEATQFGALAVGAGFALGAVILMRSRRAAALAAVGLAVASVGLWAQVIGVSVLSGIVTAAALLVASSVLASDAPLDARGPWITVVALGTGWVLFVAGTFAYYAFYAYLPAIWVLTALVVVAAVAAPWPDRPQLNGAVAVTCGLLAVIAPAAWLALTPVPTVAEPAQALPLIRVMTYNAHQGFDAGDVPSLDRIADTIAREDPQVVVLQEVVRGWSIDHRHDVLAVLASRLRMAYVFGPAIGDLYGNAILSRYPITDVRRVHYPKEPGARYQPRGAILARVAGILIIATHLDENGDASVVRQEQVRALLDAWDGAKPAVLACDCNAVPEAPELALIDAAGFGDLAAQSGGNTPTFPADGPQRRVDYLFGIGVTAAQGHVVSSTASDHRAVVVNVSRRP